MNNDTMHSTVHRFNDTQIVRTIFHTFTAIPVITLMTLLVFYGLTALETGHFPTYSNPDASTVTFRALAWVVLIGIPLTLGTLPVWLWLAMQYHINQRHVLLSVITRVYVLAVGGFLFINYFTPVVEWFVD